MNILVDLSSRILGKGLVEILRDYGPGILVSDDPATSPDIVLFDRARCCPQFFDAHLQARYVLIDTGLDPSEISWLLVRHPISGVIPPSATLHNLHKALRTILSGEIWIDQKNLKALLNNASTLPERGGIRGLSEQDQKIVELITRGDRNREIAEQLCLCEQTIKSHVSRIFKTLNVKNRAQLVSLALEGGRTHT